MNKSISELDAADAIGQDDILLVSQKTANGYISKKVLASNFKGAAGESGLPAIAAFKAEQTQINANLQTSINSVSGGYIGAFATLAELNAKTGMTAGQVAKVMNDTTATNNGDYRYTGSAWVKGYDPSADAKTYTDTKINALDFSTPVMTGSDIYYKSKDEPNKLFSAIWQEYNKPVWFIGNNTLVDSVGATLSTVEQELVFTVKLTADDQTFVYPTRNDPSINPDTTIDWGDGTVQRYTSHLISHTYAGLTGAEYQIKVRGTPKMFDFSAANAARNTSKIMVKSIDKNTLPQTMQYFSLVGCVNLTYLCRGAYSSWVPTAAFNPNYANNSPNISFHAKAFEGLESVTNINNIFGVVGKQIMFDIPAGLLDPFVNVTSASNAFYGMTKPIPVGLFDKMVNLQNVNSMFMSATIDSIDNRIFKNQTKLADVGSCFRLCSNLVADAKMLYDDMVRGNPTTVSMCFNGAAKLINLSQVPSTWK